MCLRHDVYLVNKVDVDVVRVVREASNEWICETKQRMTDTKSTQNEAVDETTISIIIVAHQPHHISFFSLCLHWRLCLRIDSLIPFIKYS